LILLDTNICIHIINAKPAAVLQLFRDHRVGEIGICSVVAAELAYGVANSGSTRNRQALDLFLAPLAILPFAEAALWCCGDLRAELECQGTPFGALDTLIAAHALSLQATLVSNNLKEFERVPAFSSTTGFPAPDDASETRWIGLQAMAAAVLRATCSKTNRACCSVTPGNSSTNSAWEPPSSMFSNRAATGMRVPRTPRPR
jgi:tRNA(fMet)-specific endonuclease VapC